MLVTTIAILSSKYLLGATIGTRIALVSYRLVKLTKDKIKTRKDTNEYLLNHPELFTGD